MEELFNVALVVMSGFLKKNDQKQTKINEIETIDNIEIFNQDVQSENDQSKSSKKKK